MDIVRVGQLPILYTPAGAEPRSQETHHHALRRRCRLPSCCLLAIMSDECQVGIHSQDGNNVASLSLERLSIREREDVKQPPSTKSWMWRPSSDDWKQLLNLMEDMSKRPEASELLIYLATNRFFRFITHKLCVSPF